MHMKELCLFTEIKISGSMERKIFLCGYMSSEDSLQCRCILGRQKLLVYVQIIVVVAAIFDFMTEED